MPGFGGLGEWSVRTGTGEPSELTASDFIPSSCVREKHPFSTHRMAPTLKHPEPG